MSEPRFLDAFRQLVRALTVRIDYCQMYPARVVAQNGDGTLELRPDSLDLPGVSAVPIRYGVPGVSARVPAGAYAHLGFEGGDPARPYAVVPDASQALEITVRAKTVNVIADKVRSGDPDGDCRPVARVGDMVECLLEPLTPVNGVISPPPAPGAFVGTLTLPTTILGVITSGAERTEAS